jgi:ribose transport system ATP-binding protein
MFMLSPERSGCFEVRSLRTKRYPSSVVSFDIGEGEILGVAGLVGAGRSEVAQAIFGVDTPLEVTMLLEGQPLSIQSPRDAIWHGIYLVPEDRRQMGLILDAVIRENITASTAALCVEGMDRWPQERAVASRDL